PAPDAPRRTAGGLLGRCPPSLTYPPLELAPEADDAFYGPIYVGFAALLRAAMVQRSRRDGTGR
ncbi:hypothetical protein, partial [Nocardioides sp.]|uniref:hypothetical protein n=1 Tax=Nocardioides sp. TaxID=35761 RepID=UPI003512CF8E